MARDYIEALRTKRGEVMADIEGLRQQIGVFESRLTLKENQLRNLDDLLVLENGQVSRGEPGAAVAPERRASSLTNHVHQVLADLGKPIHYRELVRLLAEQQVHVPGKDPGANLIAHISRDERFARVGRGTYGLSEWPSVKATKTTQHRRRARKRAR